MKPGRELDALVAEKVIGLRQYRNSWLDAKGDYKYHDDYQPDYVSKLPRYSEDISAAWEVVEKLREKEFSFYLAHDSGGIEAEFVHYEWESTPDAGFESSALTAPHAICLAALKAVGVEV